MRSTVGNAPRRAGPLAGMLLVLVVAAVAALVVVVLARPVMAVSEEVKTSGVSTHESNQALSNTASPEGEFTTQATSPPTPITTCDSYTGPTYNGFTCAPNGFVTKVFTVSGGGTVSCSWQYRVEWGDGKVINGTFGDAGTQVFHSYSQPGFAYHVVITGSGSPASNCVFNNSQFVVAVPAFQGDPPTGTTASGDPYWSGGALFVRFNEQTGEFEVQLGRPGTTQGGVNAASAEG